MRDRPVGEEDSEAAMVSSKALVRAATVPGGSAAFVHSLSRTRGEAASRRGGCELGFSGVVFIGTFEVDAIGDASTCVGLAAGLSDKDLDW